MMTIWEKLARCSSAGEIKRMVEGTNFELVEKVEIERLRTIRDWYADPGHWYAPEGPEASVMWQGGQPWKKAVDGLTGASASASAPGDEIHCAVCNEDMAVETDWATECGRDDCPHFKPSDSAPPPEGSEKCL